jgi:hypothetical protein
VSADTCRVVHRVLVFASVVCCTLVAASFVFFARDQVAGASKHQQNELVAGAPAATAAPVVVHHGQPRAFIDNAANTLTSPFSSLVHSNNDWVTHGFPAAVALLVYGLGIGYVARFAQEKA